MITMAIILALFAQSQSALEATYNAANLDMQEHRWSEAAAKYEVVLERAPNHVPTLFNLAVCYTNLANSKRAIEVYTKLLEQDGTVFEARINLALLLVQSGDQKSAEEQVDKALALRPNDPNADMFAASFFEELNQFDRAYIYLIHAEEKGLKTPALYIAMSQAETRRGNDDKGRIYLERAAQLDPSNNDIRYELGVAYRKAGQYENAIRTLKSIPEARGELAQAYLGARKYDEAASLLQELVEKEPKNADFAYMLAQSYIGLRRYPEAVSALQRVIELKPDYSEAYAELGSALYAEEDWAGAAAALARFLQFKPNHALSNFLLATCLDRLGSVKEALAWYKTFLALDDNSDSDQSAEARRRLKALEDGLLK